MPVTLRPPCVALLGPSRGARGPVAGRATPPRSGRGALSGAAFCASNRSGRALPLGLTKSSLKALPQRQRTTVPDSLSSALPTSTPPPPPPGGPPLTGGGGGGGGSDENPGPKALSLGLSAVAVGAGLAGSQKEEKPVSVLERAEEAFEYLLFSSRFLVLGAVIGAVIMGGCMFAKGMGTVAKAVKAVMAGSTGSLGIKAIESLDDFLTGCASLVFGMGLFELFIKKMKIADPEEDPEAHAKQHKGGFNIEHRPSWLALDSLGELKHRTGAVVIFILVVKILELSAKVPITEPLHLVWLSASTLLSASAVTLMGIEFNEPKHEEEKH